ncbi:MAG: helix-turn-helix transcriptional regulator [Thermomicrobiales bacterium]
MPPVGSLSAPILIGRERELAALQSFIAAGRGVLLMSGEAGIGKSRLVREAAAHASALGYRVVQGSCFDRDRGLPYALVLDLIRDYLASSADDARAHLLAVAPGCSRLLPALAAPPTSTAALDPEQERRRLGHEMEALLAGLAAERPLLLVVEDIHWSDEASFELLSHLARRAAAIPLALAITYRGDERGPSLQRFLAEIDRQRSATEIALRLLTSADVAQLLRAMLDLPRPAGALFVRSLHALTGGNPFFVEEVVRSLIAEGGVYPSHEGWQRKPLDQLHIPRSVEDAVRRRTAILSSAAAEVLTLAALAGRRVDFGLLLDLCGLAEDGLIAAIKELIAAQLLVEISADVFVFRHALTQQAISASLLARERRALHARMAQAIERGAIGGIEAPIEELAYHSFEAGDWERAHVLARKAGDRAQALYAPQAAAAHYTRALEAATQLDLTADAGLLHARGQAFDAIGDFDAARGDFEAALAAAETAGDAETMLSALLDLGLLWSGRDYDRARTWLLRGIDLARTMTNPAALAQTLNRLGNWHANHEDTDEALRYHGEALAIFELLDDRRGIAETLDLLAMAQSLGGDLPGARQAAARAARLFEALGDRQGLAGSLPMTILPSAVFETETLAGGGSVAGAIVAAEHALSLARDIDWRSGEAYLTAILGELWAVAGDFGKALALLHESIAIAEEIDHRQWMAQARWGLARLYGTMLAPARERQELERVLALARDIHSRIWANLATGGLASSLVALGETDAAQALLVKTLTHETPMRACSQRQLWVASAELALAQDRPHTTLDIIDRLYATAINFTTEGEILRLALIKAAALAAMHEITRAEALLRTALVCGRDQGARPMLRALHHELAVVLRRQGRTEDAGTEAAAAREIGERLAVTIPDGGLRAEFLHAAGLAAGDPEAAPQEADANGGALTPREREVAAHIAAGITNREIAARLFISERTVEAHVANIRRKLGASSRAGIAAWAAQRGVAPPST